MRPRLRSWRSWNICAPATSSYSTRNGSRPICNNLAGSKFRAAIICACYGEQSICRGDFCSAFSVFPVATGLRSVGFGSSLPSAHGPAHGAHEVTSPTTGGGPQGRGYRLIVPESDRYYGFKWLLGF